MKLLRRNLTSFEYRACIEQEEVLDDGRHTGRYATTYDDPVVMKGNLTVPSGYVSDRWFGIETNYTHILLVDDPKADIRENGLVCVGNDKYEIRAVRPSLNMMSIALRKLHRNPGEGED